MSRRPELFDLKPSDLPVVIDEHVRWGDMDAYGHMNNAVFFRLFEGARMAYFERINFTEPNANEGLGPILAHTECYFRRPLAYPQSLTIGARIKALESDRFTMEYGIFISGDEPVLAACGSGQIICYNYQQKVRGTIPPPVLDQIHKIEGARLHP